MLLWYCLLSSHFCAGLRPYWVVVTRQYSCLAAVSVLPESLAFNIRKVHLCFVMCLFLFEERFLNSLASINPLLAFN